MFFSEFNFIRILDKFMKNSFCDIIPNKYIPKIHMIIKRTKNKLCDPFYGIFISKPMLLTFSPHRDAREKLTIFKHESDKYNEFDDNWIRKYASFKCIKTQAFLFLLLKSITNLVKSI